MLTIDVAKRACLNNDQDGIMLCAPKEMSGVRVMRNRTINYELGVRVTISCKMMFDDYPLDAHSCQFQVGSCELVRLAGRPVALSVCRLRHGGDRALLLPVPLQLRPPAQSAALHTAGAATQTVQCGSPPVRSANIATTHRPHNPDNRGCAAGHYAACGFQVRLQRKQMQYQIQVENTAVSPAHQLPLSGRSTFPASCSW